MRYQITVRAQGIVTGYRDMEVEAEDEDQAKTVALVEAQLDNKFVLDDCDPGYPIRWAPGTACIDELVLADEQGEQA